MWYNLEGEKKERKKEKYQEHPTEICLLFK